MNNNSRDRPIRMWLKCPNCQWTFFLYRKRSNDYLCRHCGATFTADWKEKVTILKQVPVFNHRKEK